MTLEQRLKNLSLEYKVPLQQVVQVYEGRYSILQLFFGRMYEGRESQLRYRALKELMTTLEDK